MNHVAHPKGCQTETGNADDEADDGDALVPCGVGELQVMLVGAGAVEYLTYHTEDIDGGDDDAAAGGDGHGHQSVVVGWRRGSVGALGGVAHHEDRK